jgi:hypothetical protein
MFGCHHEHRTFSAKETEYVFWSSEIRLATFSSLYGYRSLKEGRDRITRGVRLSVVHFQGLRRCWTYYDNLMYMSYGLYSAACVGMICIF